MQGLQLPTATQVDSLLELVGRMLFPDVFGSGSESELQSRLAAFIDIVLKAQPQDITPQAESSTAAVADESMDGRPAPAPPQTADDISREFMRRLPSIGKLLKADIKAVAANDPAATSHVEVMCCYPAFTAMLHYRVAHALYELRVPLLPRIITERAHERTGIDIHPAAQIGPAFGIDHGTGIVIGATAIIGAGVMVYQGVTLGAKHFTRDSDGHMLDLPRHPIVEDYVTIYSNTSLLGRIRIGHHSVIGGNLWITHDVPPYSQVRQSRALQQSGFVDGDGI
jgi:serine O-acetyltransferase